MTAQRYDAVVVGAGHNGLVCAAYLARAGRRVLVVERRHKIGGATTTVSVRAPDWTHFWMLKAATKSARKCCP